MYCVVCVIKFYFVFEGNQEVLSLGAHGRISFQRRRVGRIWVVQPQEQSKLITLFLTKKLKSVKGGLVGIIFWEQD